MRDLLPILKTLSKNKASPLLLVLQIALTFTILVNTIYMMVIKEQELTKPTGLTEQQLFSFSTNLEGTDEEKNAALDTDLADIRALASVESASTITSMPLTNWGRSLDVGFTPEEDERITHAGYYGSDDTIVDTLGLRVVAGRNFKYNDVIHKYFDGHSESASVLVSQALAHKIRPNDWRSVVGETIYVESVPQKVVGIVETMKSPWRFWYAYDMTVIGSIREHYEETIIVVRAKPDQRETAMAEVQALLLKKPGRQVDAFKSFEQIKTENLQADYAVSQTLKAVIAALACVTMLGIFGQARYTVHKRRKQIGTRRALGATQADILRYFMIENAVVSLFGITLGIIIAITANIYLVNYFGLTSVPGDYLIVGAIIMLVAGQLAVTYPAMVAAKVPPAIATRTA
ncbi:ABC transporter permease (plasmid) [Pseudoalteromonas piscicida]|uniref:ABC transporter permease n=1 Tax=Pseudoalteromonas TaxID=53246 RepID=UPI00029A372E|nr:MULTISPECIES: FtsX-like permease family protein [Pseudoalteromonas]MCF7515661.1 ABC transporter permease [Pseudoalteromonas sp. L7]MCF7527682.1 ABC transporter permease [Pseudoalteromonas sp. L23]MCG7552646.1 ABC transporter permease [Pseudoalteromonas sp. Of11M-6]MCX2767987.1 ABC transporter permease [Pseudoalteromonas sp. B530]QUI69053.1 FtsX-like permease family protein [Pseudoalteromonas sp. M8]